MDFGIVDETVEATMIFGLKILNSSYNGMNIIEMVHCPDL